MTRSNIKIGRIALSFGAAVVCAALSSGCAAQGPPGGGPEDKTGPQLISSFPESGSVNVKPDVELELIFSEPIEPRSVESSLQLTPSLKQAPVVKTYRKRATINFIEPLRENTTYIVNFGRGIRDYRKNLSEKNIAVAFATGDSLDNGVIRGRVFTIPKKHTVQVWAYRISTGFPDSILGATPDYQTAVEADGSFRLINLAKGRYRLLAISAESPKIAIVDENCLIGLPATDPIIIDSRDAMVSDINFRLSAFYLNPFRLLKAGMLNDKIELIFSRSLNADRNDIIDVDIDRDAQIHSAWISHSDSKTMLLNVRGMIPDSVYTVRVDGIVDDRGNRIGADQEVAFTFRATADTLSPEIVATFPARGAKNVDLEPEIRIVFSEALKPVIPDTSITMMSQDSVVIDFSMDWRASNVLLLKPSEALEAALEYRLQADCSEWLDVAGNGFEDSLFSMSFTTLDANSFGSISGSVVLSDSSVENLTISCSLDGTDHAPITLELAENGDYLFDSLLPGAYRFEIWEDRNNNGQWDKGSLKPFIPAEPYRAYPGKINVRARWETAEVDWSY